MNNDLIKNNVNTVLYKGGLYMKSFKIKKIISIICCGIGFIISLYGLIVGIRSIGEYGWGEGLIFIMLSIIALTIIILDFLISIDKKKGGLKYSFIISLIKIIMIICFIPSIIYQNKMEMQYNTLSLEFDFLFIISLIIFTIPSFLNFIKLRKSKRKH